MKRETRIATAMLVLAFATAGGYWAWVGVRWWDCRSEGGVLIDTAFGRECVERPEPAA